MLFCKNCKRESTRDCKCELIGECLYVLHFIIHMRAYSTCKTSLKLRASKLKLQARKLLACMYYTIRIQKLFSSFLSFAIVDVVEDAKQQMCNIQKRMWTDYKLWSRMQVRQLDLDFCYVRPPIMVSGVVHIFHLKRLLRYVEQNICLKTNGL